MDLSPLLPGGDEIEMTGGCLKMHWAKAAAYSQRSVEQILIFSQKI